MRIGELADATGVTTKTIRYYEDINLLPAPDRSIGGYRQYSQSDVDRLAFIRRARELDLGLDEIAEILTLREQDQRPCDYVLDLAGRRISELDERITRMQQTRRELATLLNDAQNLTPHDGCYCQLIEHRPEPTPELARRDRLRD